MPPNVAPDHIGRTGNLGFGRLADTAGESRWRGRWTRRNDLVVDSHGHEMSAADASRILRSLDDAGVSVVVGGGWGVDALLGEQTPPHADLDVWLSALQFEHMVRAVSAMGLDRLYPWGDDRPWNFVLHDGGRLRVDLHIFEVLRNGELHYGSAIDGRRFPSERSTDTA